MTNAPETPPRPDQLDLEPIKARLEATTNGRWTHAANSLGDPQVFIDDDLPGRALIVSEVNQHEAWGNAAFIAHARQDIPALIAEIERLRAASVPPAPPTDPDGEIRYGEDRAMFAAGVKAARRDSVGATTDNDLIDHLWSTHLSA